MGLALQVELEFRNIGFEEGGETVDQGFLKKDESKQQTHTT